MIRQSVAIATREALTQCRAANDEQAAELAAVTRQRDALLAALQAILDPATNGYRASDELLSRARAALAACKEG